MSISSGSAQTYGASRGVAPAATKDAAGGKSLGSTEHVLDREQERICALCCGSIRAPFSSCLGCMLVGRQLGGRLVPVLPVRLARRDGETHRLLVAYKAAPSTYVRVEAARRLSDKLAVFLLEQLDGCGSPASDVRQVVTVPSTGLGRPSWNGTHPLVGVVARAVEELEARGRSLHLALDALERGEAPLGHLRAAPTAYRVRRSDDARLLSDAPAIVVDDLYTSGAHAQSAARSLHDAGIVVTAVVPLGRLLRSGDPRAVGAA